jgi:hypothetical protein
MHRMRALVMVNQESWFANGEHTQRQYRPPSTGDVGWLLDTAATPEWFRPAAEGVIVYDKLPVASAEVLVHRARAAGWGTTNKGIEGLDQYGWATFTKIGAPTIHVGILAKMSQSRTSLFRLDGSAEMIADALARYHVATTVAWRGQAGMNAHALIRRCHGSYSRKSEPLWYWRVPSAAKECIGSTELKWSRPLAAAERQHEMVATWDIRAMYLAAATNAELAWSAPEHTGPRAFEPSAAGYWLIRPPVLPGPPIVLPERVRADGTAWVTTPVMVYYAKQRLDGMPPEVLDSWTARKTGRYLKEWAGLIRDALALEVPDEVRAAIKDTYARGVSMLTRSGGLIYRPDWRDEIVSRAIVNQRYKIDAAYNTLGIYPVRVNVDELMYSCDKDNVIDIGHALAAADGIGKFKTGRAWPMADYLKRYGNEQQ